MADNQLVITAGLNIPETVHNIQEDLDQKVAPEVHLDITCTLDTKNIALGGLTAMIILAMG